MRIDWEVKRLDQCNESCSLFTFKLNSSDGKKIILFTQGIIISFYLQYKLRNLSYVEIFDLILCIYQKL